ncbi:OmpA family protein [Nitrosomonas sp. sh817]|jgi:outer membrane protein OmpA-like peptidoglycan-associated protein|uniref:OmpA family protein n=1 Tax=Nitrosomonas sp. sh817 TaxID=3070658 RepID=UPI0027DDC3E8|nr:OmpA family protein [Nitrosomonas sp. sh817]WMJ07479.1 OmpA family protein [Nitrosomonas sp. sh817]
MIRSIFYGLSVIFFSLAILIIYKAVKNPGDHSSPINLPSELALTPEPAYSPPAPPPPFPDLANHESSILDHHTSAPNNEARIADTQQENQSNAPEAVTQDVIDSKAESQSRTLIVFSGKTFRSGQDVIQDVAYTTIEKLVKEINASPGSLILIEGHTDNIPTGKIDSDNAELSSRRAKAIANILMLHGIPSQRISIKGYGDTRPIDSNNTEEGRAKNRRVEVKLIPREGNI